MKGELSLKQAIGEYKDIYLAYRNFAQRTREEYGNDLEDLVEFLEIKGVRYVTEVGLSHLVRYMAELEKRGYAGSTRKRKTVSIKSFFSFIYLESHTRSNVAKRLIPPFVEARRPRFLTKEECARLLECAKSNKRDLAIIQLLLQTGIKLSELTGLNVNDLQTAQMTGANGNSVEYIWIVSNHRNKGRAIPLARRTTDAIHDYLLLRNKMPGENLFLNKRKEEIGKRGVEKIVEKYFKKAGIKNASVNSLRHTFGTQHAFKGTSRKILRTIMGYRDPRTIVRYFSIYED